MVSVMSDAAAGTPILEHEVPDQRDCTRCDGIQHLVVSDDRGMGKYRCDTCDLVVGFDLQADRMEFLIDRGRASRYTKDVFGEELLASEHRLRPSPQQQ